MFEGTDNCTVILIFTSSGYECWYRKSEVSENIWINIGIGSTKFVKVTTPKYVKLSSISGPYPPCYSSMGKSLSKSFIWYVVLEQANLNINALK